MIKCLRKQSLIDWRQSFGRALLKDFKVLIKNELFRNKSLLADKSSDEMSRKKINMWREAWKNKDFISKALLQTIK